MLDLACSELEEGALAGAFFFCAPVTAAIWNRGARQLYDAAMVRACERRLLLDQF